MSDERCETRVELRQINVLPKTGIPNLCATCSGNKGPECPVVKELERHEREVEKQDWNDNDGVYAC